MTQTKRMSMPAQIVLGGFIGLFAAGAVAWSVTALNVGMRQVLDGLPLIAVLFAFVLMAITAVRCWWVRSYFPIVLCLFYVAGIGFALMLSEYSGSADDSIVVRLCSIMPWAFFGLCLTSAIMSFMGVKRPDAVQ
ncbi:hypothetical protein [Burkholderia vietnamiensis]|uniref:hypothetical protein n=1 Tax=Burkholderia vietnamiensis TaxID=60552 RepID=UPI00159359DE|nr:hypothetical protein [Burkholderia vietnamiensis]